MKKRIENRGLKEQRRDAEEGVLKRKDQQMIQDAESLKSWIGKGTG